jgi:hypothetical protein
MPTEAKAERDPEGAIMVELNTKTSEHTYALRGNEARQLLIDLIHATGAEFSEEDDDGR